MTFDATALLRSNGTGLSGINPIVARVDGQDIFATVAASGLPSTGSEARDFTWGAVVGRYPDSGHFRNADFAPGANLQVAAVPEPEAYALMLAGFSVLGFICRRRPRSKQAP